MDSHVLALNANTCDPENLKQRFLSAGMRLMHIGRLAGYRIVVATDSRLPYFSALPVERQEWVVETLEVSNRIYTSMIANKSDMRDNSALVWSAFRELGLRPPSDFFDKVGSEDVIQLYSEDHVHLFANFRFFELCSYTIEEIYSLPWSDLWSRSESDLQRIFQIIGQVKDPAVTTTLTLNEPPHAVKELASAFKFELNYALRCIAPLWDQRTRQRGGLIVIERVQITSERNLADEERALAGLSYLDSGAGDLSLV